MMQLNLTNTKILEDLPGVYKIYAYSINGTPIPVNRFAGIDPTGLLYIGSAYRQSLRKRLYNFIATTRYYGKTTNHSGALKYRVNGAIKATLGEHNLFFSVEIHADALSREAELLMNYKLLFGEYPPLNK